MNALPLPCPLLTPLDDVRHVCGLYGISARDWRQLADDEWRHVCATVKPEYTVQGNIPQSFHMLPFFRAHSLYSSCPTRRQSANWARADILEPYFSEDE